jgi:hypothetical protein
MIDWLLKFIVVIVAAVFSIITIIILSPFILLCVVTGLVLFIIGLLYSGCLFVIKCFKNLFGYV